VRCDPLGGWSAPSARAKVGSVIQVKGATMYDLLIHARITQGLVGRQFAVRPSPSGRRRSADHVRPTRVDPARRDAP
jgi:hypothetical protein